MSMFVRSISEDSESIRRSPSLASIRERFHSDSWSTHEDINENDNQNYNSNTHKICK